MPNCTSCGSPIPEGQGKSCSMCMGDISHGTDGYYEDWARQQLRKEEEAQAEERYQQTIEQERREEEDAGTG